MSTEAPPRKDSWMTRPRSIVEKIGMSFGACFAWTILWIVLLSGTMSFLVPAPGNPLHPTADEIVAVDKAGRPLAVLGMLLGGGGYLAIVVFIMRRPGLEHRVT